MLNNDQILSNKDIKTIKIKKTRNLLVKKTHILQVTI